MGMFDAFIISRKCSSCRATALREVQTKAFANILARYRVGDVVEGAPLGEFWLKEDWWCDKCHEEKKIENQYQHQIYLYLVDGLFVGAFGADEYKERRKRALDTYEVMQHFYKSAKKGTERKFLLSRIYNLIEGKKGTLLNEILGMIKHQEGSEIEEPPPW